MYFFEPFSKKYLMGKREFKKSPRDLLHITASDLSLWEEVKVVVERSHISVPCHLCHIDVGQHALRIERIVFTHST